MTHADLISLNIFNNHGGSSGKGGAVGNILATGGASWVGLGGKRAQNSPLCGRRPHSGSQTHMGPYDTGGYCKDV